VSNPSPAVRVLKYSTLALFVGWGLLHIFWEVPYRALLWKEAWMSGIIERIFGMKWGDYVSSERAESIISSAIVAIGGFHLLCAASVFTLHSHGQKFARMLLLGSLSLLFVGFLLFLNTGYQLAVWLEQALQISAPLFLFALCVKKIPANRLILPMKIVIAITFISHGLYAMGVLPVPGDFVDMFIMTIGVNESQARMLLKLVGVMDLVLGVAIFIPRTAIPALIYACIWGFLTAIARPWAHIDDISSFQNITYWLLQGLYRLPHAGLPLALLLMIRSSTQTQRKDGTP